MLYDAVQQICMNIVLLNVDGHCRCNCLNEEICVRKLDVSVIYKRLF